MIPIRIYIPVVSFLLAICAAACAQTSDIVTNDGITSPLHKANIGRITFMEKTIPIENYKESDFLSTLTLDEKGDFTMRAFLGNSLTNYLHQLAPALSAEALNKAGNYQFSFFVDSVLIYTENLHPGAGGLTAKNTRTILRIPFISSTQEDSWGRFLWSRFMARGGQEALTPGEHKLRVSIQTYIDQGTIETGPQLAEGTIRLVVPRLGREVTNAQVQPQPIAEGSGWNVDLTPLNTERIVAMNRKIEEGGFKDITSIVVIRNGQLLLEEYFNGARRSTRHDTRSVGKSFASAAMGLAIRDGFIPNENVTLSRFYDLHAYNNYTPRKDSVTLKSLLTMSSGFDGSDDNPESPGNEENMYPTKDWVKFTLDLPMDNTKTIGRNWDYFTAGVVVLGDILNRTVPGGLEKYADKTLFAPLGIRQYTWQYTPQHVANTAGGIKLRALDLAKFGQLYKNGGTWHGQTILPAAWVTQTLTPHLPLPQARGHYGYLFWNTAYTLNGIPHEAFYCSGNGGNKIFIFKDLPLVVVITATAYNKMYAHPQADRLIEHYILPAVLSNPKP